MELPVLNIQLEGRAWQGEEAIRRHGMLPGRLEMLHGKLLWSDEERLMLLGAMLEQVGAAAAVRLGDPAVWRAAVAALDGPASGAAARDGVMDELIAKAAAIVANSTAPEAKGFDAEKWLARWIETPQPALGGRKPSELLDTPQCAEAVLRLLGAIESGAYQ
jgi:hypothetical protein